MIIPNISGKTIQSCSSRHQPDHVYKWYATHSGCSQGTALKDLWHLVVFQQLWSPGGKVFVEDEHGDLTQRCSNRCQKDGKWWFLYVSIKLIEVLGVQGWFLSFFLILGIGIHWDSNL